MENSWLHVLLCGINESLYILTRQLLAWCGSGESVMEGGQGEAKIKHICCQCAKMECFYIFDEVFDTTICTKTKHNKQKLTSFDNNWVNKSYYSLNTDFKRH